MCIHPQHRLRDATLDLFSPWILVQWTKMFHPNVPWKIMHKQTHRHHTLANFWYISCRLLPELWRLESRQEGGLSVPGSGCLGWVLPLSEAPPQRRIQLAHTSHTHISTIFQQRWLQWIAIYGKDFALIELLPEVTYTQTPAIKRTCNTNNPTFGLHTLRTAQLLGWTPTFRAH